MRSKCRSIQPLHRHCERSDPSSLAAQAMPGYESAEALFARRRKQSRAAKEDWIASSATPPRNDELTTSVERLLDLALQHTVDIVWCDRSDQLERDSAVASNNECFRHAVDAPFDRGAAIGV